MLVLCFPDESSQFGALINFHYSVDIVHELQLCVIEQAEVTSHPVTLDVLLSI
jgi:hypothetical protein